VVVVALALELQVSCEPPAVSRQRDMSKLLTVWNSPTAVHGALPDWSRLTNGDIASVLNDDSMKLDGAVIYSTDPDHEPEDDEDDCANEQPVANSEKVPQVSVGQRLLWFMYCFDAVGWAAGRASGL